MNGKRLSWYAALSRSVHYDDRKKTEFFCCFLKCFFFSFMSVVVWIIFLLLLFYSLATCKRLLVYVCIGFCLMFNVFVLLLISQQQKNLLAFPAEIFFSGFILMIWNRMEFRINTKPFNFEYSLIEGKPKLKGALKIFNLIYFLIDFSFTVVFRLALKEWKILF